jgi:hypothetical protein
MAVDRRTSLRMPEIYAKQLSNNPWAKPGVRGAMGTVNQLKADFLRKKGMSLNATSALATRQDGRK